MPRELLSRWRRHRKMQPVILMYHRVADVLHDPWSLCVRPERFGEQMEWLRRRRRVLPMAEFASRHAAGILPADAVAITFDDGYLDNLETARPVIARLGLHATLFVVSGMVGRSGAFWWDELTSLILTGPAADTVATIGRQTMVMRWGERPARPDWCAGDPPPSPREAGYLALWEMLQRLPEDERQEAMATLRCLLPCDPSGLARCLTREELSALVADGTFTLGGHSITHPALTSLPDEDVRREIVESILFCKDMHGGRPIGFAYHYGDVDERIWRAAVSAGVDWACSTRRTAVTPKCDRLVLPRLAVGNWTANELDSQLKLAGRHE